VETIPVFAGSALTNLDLSRNLLGDGAIERLVKLKRLRLLRISHNRFVSVSVSEYADRHEPCEAVMSLSAGCLF
jgi:hypothetical protein